MYSKKYLCHTWQDGKCVGSRRFDSRASIRAFLRKNDGHFTDSFLSDLEEDSIEIPTKDENLFYEVEALAENIPDYICCDNIYYVSLPLWARQHGVTIQKALNMSRSRNRVKKGERLYVEVEKIEC